MVNFGSDTPNGSNTGFNRPQTGHKLGDQKADFYRQAHEHSDVDFEIGALHHTLGSGPTQAAPGNHVHGAGQTDGSGVGHLIFTAGTTLVANYMWCDGSVLDRATFDLLFAEIGTRYNIGGELSTQFRLPDTRKRHIRGTPDNIGNPTMDSTAVGSRVFTHAISTTALTAPSHSHGITVASDGAHSHSIASDGGHGHTGSSGTAPAHSHSISAASMGTVSNTATGGTATRLNSGETHDHGASTGSAGSHSHSIGTDGAHTHTGTTGGGVGHTHAGSSVGGGGGADLTHTHTAPAHPGVDFNVMIKYQ